MKTNLLLINSLGLNAPSKRAWFAANVLDVATIPSPPVAISPAVPAVPQKPAILAQTAKPARPASLPVTAANNTVGYGFGELYLNSPAYPIGTAIPAIPAKPASAAVTGVPATGGSLAVAALTSPAIAAIPGWDRAIDCEVISSSALRITAYLPYAFGARLFGVVLKGIDNILEMTPPALNVTAWKDLEGTIPVTQFTTIANTMERFLYQAALDLVAEDPTSNKIEQVIYVVAGKATPCHKLTLNLAALDYDAKVESLQLQKIGAVPPSIINTMAVGTVVGAEQLIENDTRYSALIFDDSSRTLPMKIVIPGNSLIPGNIFMGFVPAKNQDYASDAAWLAFVATTLQGSMEREFTLHVQNRVPDGYTFPPFYFTRAEAVGKSGGRVGSKYIDSSGGYWEYYRRGYGAPDN